MAYLAAAKAARDVVGSAEMSPDESRKAMMMLDLIVDALAPTNFLPTNPAALQKAFDTAGASLLKGARNFVDDVRQQRRKAPPGGQQRLRGRRQPGLHAVEGGVPQRADAAAAVRAADRAGARAARCCAARRGSTSTTSWISRPNRSFIEWAVKHGRTVFAISYKNPSADMSGTTMDDYLVHGPQTALDVVQEITGADTIDIVGLCLGGAMTAITAAYLTQQGDNRVGTLTLLNTMLDYAQPGQLGAFTDMKSVERLERKMRKAGTLEGETMAGTFDILRANDLIFNYVVSNWLMGQPPPAFDILAWNADSTRMPATMHAFYLKNFYVQNKLAAGELEIGGATIDLSVIKSPTYVVSAINDHIVLWESAYKTVNLVSGPVRFVLGSGGHIAGIVSPPGPKVWYQVADGDEQLPATGAEWRADRGAPVGHLVGRLGPMVGREFRSDDRPAAVGQPDVPGARRRSGQLRQGLSNPAQSEPAPDCEPARGHHPPGMPRTLRWLSGPGRLVVAGAAPGAGARPRPARGSGSWWRSPGCRRPRASPCADRERRSRWRPPPHRPVRTPACPPSTGRSRVPTG